MRKKRTVKGSFTVEAAYLMPIVFFLIWNILYLAFFLYNQSVILEGSYCSGLRAERLVGTEEEKRELLEEKFDRDVRRKIIYGKIQEEKFMEKKEIIIETKMEMKAPGGLFFNSDWNGLTKQSVKRFYPVSFIRKSRKVHNILSEIINGE